MGTQLRDRVRRGCDVVVQWGGASVRGGEHLSAPRHPEYDSGYHSCHPLMRTSIFALLLLACFACAHAQREPSDLAEARSRYFVEPRAFPFGEILPGARREALDAWRRTRRVASESTGSWKPVGD